MRCRVPCVGALVAAVMLFLMPGPASAQGFFQSLFGGGQPQQAAPPPASLNLPPPISSYRAPLFNPYRAIERNPNDGNANSNANSEQSDGGGSYRTLCVRMCDGYYWPISYGARRSNFYRDANVCRSSCGAEARLFYHSKSSDVNAMIDIQGRSYSRLPVAFKYRKTLVDSCKCKPEPWAQSERDRHQMYAIKETDEDRRRSNRAPLVDGGAKIADAAAADGKVPAEQSSEPKAGSAEKIEPKTDKKVTERNRDVQEPHRPAKRTAIIAQQAIRPAAIKSPITPASFSPPPPSAHRWPGD